MLPQLSGLEACKAVRQIDWQAAGDLHHRSRPQRDGHRGDEAGGLRLFAEAAGQGAGARPGRPCGRDAAADEHSGRGQRGSPTADAQRHDAGPQRGHAARLQGHRPRGAAGRHRADSGRKRHRQGAGGPGHLSAQQRATDRSWRSTARRFPRRCWRASCSATRRARSPAPTRGGSASSSNATAARSFSTRSATCRRCCKARCCAAAGAEVRARGRQPDDRDRRPDHRRHESRPGRDGQRAEVPRGPALPAQGLFDLPAAACATATATCGC